MPMKNMAFLYLAFSPPPSISQLGGGTSSDIGVCLPSCYEDHYPVCNIF